MSNSTFCNDSKSGFKKVDVGVLESCHGTVYFISDGIASL